MSSPFHSCIVVLLPGFIFITCHNIYLQFAGGEKDRESLLKCAMLVERMYTHISSVSEDFTVTSSFMVAQYVIALQRVRSFLIFICFKRAQSVC